MTTALLKVFTSRKEKEYERGETIILYQGNMYSVSRMLYTSTNACTIYQVFATTIYKKNTEYIYTYTFSTRPDVWKETPIRCLSLLWKRKGKQVPDPNDVDSVAVMRSTNQTD